MSGLERTVENMNTNINAPRDDTIAGEFFETYTCALLDRDAAAIAAHYAVPALIEFPNQRIVVFEAAQTENFFRTAFEQYEGITRADADIDVVEKTGHSVWAAVSWSYDLDVPGERNMYQLVRTDEGWKIAVLTPLDT